MAHQGLAAFAARPIDGTGSLTVAGACHGDGDENAGVSTTSGNEAWAELWPAQPSGPQVTLDGMRLVGRRPSHLKDLFTDYLATHGKQLRYSQHADACSPRLGLVLRAQRAGDIVLSRPVMVAEAWADRCWDTSEGRIPQREWQSFEW